MAETPSSSAEGGGLIPGWGTKIPHAAWCPPTHTDPKLWDFPGGPVAKTESFQCRGPGSIHGQGINSPMLQLRPGAAI